MPVTTITAATYIAPVILKTFLEHGKRKTKKLKSGEKEDEDVLDDIFFDQAFHIIKAFIELGTKNTVESLQAFTNTHVPTPFWAAVSPVHIPLSSCNLAADVLIDWFGPEELKKVVGGERWWQVRGLDGVDGEWITEKEYLSAVDHAAYPTRNLKTEDQYILRMEHLETVMLYIHGGGYFWGSINTHRHQIIRYAREFKGRAFAVNYRKAPQYPWPCPLQDVLAAYFYLTRPPKGALHKAVPSSKIVLAGDSAGGGLCISLLTILRDMGLPMPAGAVLISPWVDLTHSFPSVMENVETDIIPQHGFLAKPSMLWPIDPIPIGEGRIIPAKSNPPPNPGHADTLKPSKSRLETVDSSKDTITTGGQVLTQREMLSQKDGKDLDKQSIHSRNPYDKGDADKSTKDYDIDSWEPKPPKVLMEDPDAIPFEIRTQIQLYATTEQLTHPLVSPVLQGSLGNLPPLYILAGNNEVLRDEIIYLAHRAAHPFDYPVRPGVLRDGVRQWENAQKFTTPTKVHLQVFDGMCHVLTVFSFTDSAKCAYRSIAQFVKHVSNHETEHINRNPFPELCRPLSNISTEHEADEEHLSVWKSTIGRSKQHREIGSKAPDPPSIKLYIRNAVNASQEVEHEATDRTPLSRSHEINEGILHPVDDCKQKDILDIQMIRERVDIHGISRPMEPPAEIPALRLRPGQIGIIKERPAIRWLTGQQEWDKKYKHAAEKVLKRRSKMEAKAKLLLDNARARGLLLAGDNLRHELHESSRSPNEVDRIQADRRWGPFDLDGDKPPPSAIVKRRDTPEALAILKKSIYHTAPVTHMTVPKLPVSDAIRAAFDPKDDPNKPPQQSVAEQQVHTHIIPVHGLRMWDDLVRYFGRETSKKALKSTKQIGEQLGIVNAS